jgi:hypothetical protein
MKKMFLKNISLYRHWLLFILISNFHFAFLSAQSISIANFEDTVKYAPGSTISVHINTDGYFPKTNLFELVLSNDQGQFLATSPVIASRSDFFHSGWHPSWYKL